MTIGTGSYFPGAKFSFPMSYVYEIVIARYGDTITRLAMRFTIHAPAPDPTFAVIQFDNAFASWTSNGRTLDYCVKEFWYKAGGVGAELPLPFGLSYGKSPLTGKPALLFTWYLGVPDWESFPLDPQPLNYWLPPPLP